MLPIIGTAKAIPLRKKDHVLLIIHIELPLIEPHLSIEDEVQTFRLFLPLVNKGLLPKLRQKHRATDVIDSRKIFDPLDGFKIEHDPRKGVDICDRALLWLAHKDLEDETQVVLFDVVEVQTVEFYLFGTEDAL